MISYPERWRPRSYVIHPFSTEAMRGSNPTISNGGGWASATWPLANLALFYPFYLTEPSTALSMYVVNGAAVSGNLDAGIYKADGTRLVSIGSTAQSGTSTVQKLDIADTLLPAGETLYAALCIDNVTATTTRHAGSVGLAQLTTVGMYQQALGSVTLPATATFATISTANYIPLFGVSFVATY